MLRVEGAGPVLYVTLDRPEVKNALNEELIASLTAVFKDPPGGTRAIVLSGSGDSFCSGGDLEWMRSSASSTPEENYQSAMRVARLFESIAGCSAVVIAKISGATFGGGCGLAAAADVAVADRTARFAFSEVKLGLVPATISPHVVTKIGSGHARALFTTGEVFDAEKALRIGLVHEVVNKEDLEGVARDKVSAVLSAGPRAIAVSKSIAQQPPQTVEEAARLLADTRSGAEAVEGVAAFLEKRRASFVVK